MVLQGGKDKQQAEEPSHTSYQSWCVPKRMPSPSPEALFWRHAQKLQLHELKNVLGGLHADKLLTLARLASIAAVRCTYRIPALLAVHTFRCVHSKVGSSPGPRTRLKSDKARHASELRTL